MEREVVVDGKRLSLDLERKSGTSWVASGTYRGKPLAVEGRSEGSALTNWIRAAEQGAA